VTEGWAMWRRRNGQVATTQANTSIFQNRDPTGTVTTHHAPCTFVTTHYNAADMCALPAPLQKEIGAETETEELVDVIVTTAVQSAFFLPSGKDCFQTLNETIPLDWKCLGTRASVLGPLYS